MYLALCEKLNKYITPESFAKKNSYSKQEEFRWDQYKCSKFIELSENNTIASLNQESCVFNTVVSDRPLNSGIHYWEVKITQHSEYAIKVGVNVGEKVNLDSAFCDYPTGKFKSFMNNRIWVLCNRIIEEWKQFNGKAN